MFLRVPEPGDMTRPNPFSAPYAELRRRRVSGVAAVGFDRVPERR